MEQKKCKNKKCQKLLPTDCKYKYCENCRNKQAQQLKDIGKAAFAVGGIVVTMLTNGKINLGKKQ